jgi:hypothetical protein
MRRFRNPANGYEVEVSNAGLWCFLFGFFYFAVKGVWTHAVAALVLAIVTFGLSWFIYPLFAQQIVETNYLRKGWARVASPIDVRPTLTGPPPIPFKPNPNIGIGVLVAFGLLLVLALFNGLLSSAKHTPEPNTASAITSSVITRSSPPEDFRSVKWGASLPPMAKLRETVLTGCSKIVEQKNFTDTSPCAHMHGDTDDMDMFSQRQNVPPIFDVRVSEQLFVWSEKKLGRACLYPQLHRGRVDEVAYRIDKSIRAAGLRKRKEPFPKIDLARQEIADRSLL